MNATQKDLYKILGVISSAEIAVIKAAYKAMIMIYHPDRYVGDKESAVRKSKEINQAYAVLIDPDKRKKYNAQRVNKPEQVSDTSKKTLYELRRTLKESEEILKILDAPEQELSPLAYDFKRTLKESEEILKILNEPD